MWAQSFVTPSRTDAVHRYHRRQPDGVGVDVVAADATLDDLRKAVTTLEDTKRTARRVLGSAHPLLVDAERDLRDARAALVARESLLAKYLLYGASALAIAAFALVQRSRRR